MRWRYWNSNGYATAIVAVVNLEVGDWAAYIGGGPVEHETDCVESVARHGTKIDRELAAHIFPNIASDFQWRP